MSVQAQILAKYGVPDAAYESRFCMFWDVVADFPELSGMTNNAVSPAIPFHRIEINKDLKTALFNAFTNLRAAGLLGELKTFDGCLQHRNTRGSNVASLHSWALALDFNASTNKMLFHHVLNPFSVSGFSKAFVDIMEAAGLFWGGYYSTRFDPMHFALYNG